MEKGWKTSEFGVAVAVIIPWLSQKLGINLAALFADPENISQMINAAYDSNSAVYIAGLYIVGRIIRKWRVVS